MQASNVCCSSVVAAQVVGDVFSGSAVDLEVGSFVLRPTNGGKGPQWSPEEEEETRLACRGILKSKSGFMYGGTACAEVRGKGMIVAHL